MFFSVVVDTGGGGGCSSSSGGGDSVWGDWEWGGRVRIRLNLCWFHYLNIVSLYYVLLRNKSLSLLI